MAAAVQGGPVKIVGSRDEEGHREYLVTFLVKCAGGCGPQEAMFASGLPTTGAPYAFSGVPGRPLNEADGAAFCHPELKISRAPNAREDGPCELHHVETKFSTKPIKRCQDTEIEDPLTEPPKISGSFVKEKKERTLDRFGQPITNSAFEMIKGPTVEFDFHRPTVKIEMNIASLYLDLMSQQANRVNDATLWGVPRRCVKLNNPSFERKVQGTCGYYYTVQLEFDINWDTFDRDLLDEGTKVLAGEWTETREYRTILVNGEEPDPNNPQHFQRYKDPNGENTRVILDGGGLPANSKIIQNSPGTGTFGTGSATDGRPPGVIHVEYYREANFLLLGIPSVL